MTRVDHRTILEWAREIQISAATLADRADADPALRRHLAAIAVQAELAAERAEQLLAEQTVTPIRRYCDCGPGKKAAP